jgi:hypothetical protein
VIISESFARVNSLVHLAQAVAAAAAAAVAAQNYPLTGSSETYAFM